MQRALYTATRFAEKRAAFATFMAYDEALVKRIREFFDRKRIKHERKRMMGRVVLHGEGEDVRGGRKEPSDGARWPGCL